MIEVAITSDMLVNAQKKIDRIKFDATKGLSKFGSEKDRTSFGYLGEQMVLSYLELAEDIDNYEYDILYEGERVEVKTISCKFEPPEHYLCTVNSHNLAGIHKQSADFYVFTRILNDKSVGWILGYISCSEFFERGTFVAKGTELISGVNFEKANATVLEISKLEPIENFKETILLNHYEGK